MQRLKTDIKCKNFKNIYLLYGPETFLIEHYTTQIISENVDDDAKDFNLLSFSQQLPEESEIDNFINSYPFMSEKKVMCVKNTGLFSKSNENTKKFWTEVIENVPEYAIILFIENDVDKRNSLFKLVNQKHTACEISYLKPADLVSWTIKGFSSLSKTISHQDASYIVELCGPAMQNIRTEIDKLASFIPERAEITHADIEQLVTKNIENRVFEMIDDIAEGKNEAAIKKFHDLKTLGEEPIKIISIIFNKYSLYKKLSLLKGRPLPEICRVCNLFEKYAKNYLRHLSYMSPEKITRVMDKCMEVDFGIKSSKIEKWFGVESILTEAMRK